MSLRALLFKYWALPSLPIIMLLMLCGVPTNIACPVGGTLGAIIGFFWFSATFDDQSAGANGECGWCSRSEFVFGSMRAANERA